MVFSTNGARSLDSHRLKNEIKPLYHAIHKNLKWIQNLNERANYKTLENIRVNLYDFRFINVFSDITPEA